MDQSALFLLVIAISAFFTVRWSVRLARPGSELPVKSLIALLLAALVGLQPFAGYRVSELLRVLALIVAPLYALGPLASVALARARRYGAARFVGRLLYWSSEGREAIERLLAQVALQQADAGAALELGADRDPLLAVQVASLRQDWQGVRMLATGVPRSQANAFLVDEALVEAHLQEGRPEQAEQLLRSMRERLTDEPALQSPVSYRAVVMSEARIAADHGDLIRVRQLLTRVPQGTPAWRVYETVARAAEKAHRAEEAAALYAHAFQTAPPGARERLATSILAQGGAVPEVLPKAAAYGTWGLAGALVVLFILQELLNARIPELFTPAGRMRPSDYVAAWMQGVPGIASAEAAWRHVSYAFVHGGIVHMGFNVWVLLDLGRLYEARRSWGSFLMAFVFGTVMGAYLSGIAEPNAVQLLVGASGGVLGVGGALLADALRSGLASDRQLVRSLVQWVVLIMLFSVAIPMVSLWGHAGGLLGGLLWGFVRQGLPAGKALDRLAGGVALGVLLFALGMVVNQVLLL